MEISLLHTMLLLSLSDDAQGKILLPSSLPLHKGMKSEQKKNAITKQNRLQIIFKLNVFSFSLMEFTFYFFLGNLCNGKSPQSSEPSRKAVKSKKLSIDKQNIEDAKRLNNQQYRQPNNQNPDESQDETCSMMSAVAPYCVSKKDRNKFCGSLPNHLDSDDVVDGNFQHNNTECK